ncbi:MAG: HrdC [Chloroflexales bacterium]|nr:HrdC [Chloroflexales bacterium]
MLCRHFTIRLTPQHAQDDEARLNEFLQTIQVQSVQTCASAPGCWSVLIFYEDATQAAAHSGQQSAVAPALSPPPADEPPLTPEQQRVYDQLREWRSQRAAAEGKPAYVIAHNAVLIHIVRHHMSIRAAEDLAGIKHFGPGRAARYGPELLHLLDALTTPADAPLFEDVA